MFWHRAGLGEDGWFAHPEGAMLTAEGLATHRSAYVHAIREYHAQGGLAGKVAKSPLRFLIRHTAYHTMDHAWEMEDKDLTGKEG
ncbi:MAG: hypothetical protein IPL28_03350 [Chloroflexi bacterium]|nr:hypothetical protein [Chloroflexota bacterium]